MPRTYQHDCAQGDTVKQIKIIQPGGNEVLKSVPEVYGIVFKDVVKIQSGEVIATHGDAGAFSLASDGAVEFRNIDESLIRRVASSFDLFEKQVQAAEIVSLDAQRLGHSPRHHAGNLRRALRGIDEQAFQTKESWWSLIAELVSDDLFELE